MDIQIAKSQIVKPILESDSEDFWQILSDAEKEEIKVGIEELNQGKRISNKGFLEKIKKKLR